MTTEQAKVGDILHTSYGYDMTINNYCKVLENTGKTVKCIMIGMKGNFDGHTGEVEPDASRELGLPFRLRIRKSYDGERWYYSGSYPYCARSGDNTAKRQDSFDLWNGKPNYENHDDCDVKMSGSSDNENCARCGGIGTLQVYVDWKPHSMASGDCLKCGYSYYTALEVMDRDRLADLRHDYEYKGSRKLTVAEKKSCREYDKVIGVK